MKLSIAIPAILLSAPIGIFAHPPGVWEKCELSLRCQNDWECRQTYDCNQKALHHNPNYIFCNIGVWERNRCWVYATYPGAKMVRELGENGTEPVSD
ncbi:hypothetical protein EMPG_12598 [Blastomyces silverae]|uniref:Extracellular membrane protein CFEM domain-containing protein n=1 Tax=Blastomyces silverae TaxID=2060906 RepID=A0A0H1BM30_9EURO|nr:hypothetical protein EMPG_12598 [Blastomyces silverae]